MNKMTRTAAVLAASGAVAAGALAVAGPAAAAPGTINVDATVKCVTNHGRSATDRVITVRNTGSTTVRNINVQWVSTAAGVDVAERSAGIPALAANTEFPATVSAANYGVTRWFTGEATQANTLRPNQEVKIWHVVLGPCAGPWAIGGLVTGDGVNVDFGVDGNLDRPIIERN